MTGQPYKKFRVSTRTSVVQLLLNFDTGKKPTPLGKTICRNWTHFPPKLRCMTSSDNMLPFPIVVIPSPGLNFYPLEKKTKQNKLMLGLRQGFKGKVW